MNQVALLVLCASAAPTIAFVALLRHHDRAMIAKRATDIDNALLRKENKKLRGEPEPS